jgi:DNA-binding transcriptional regulator YiaG
MTKHFHYTACGLDNVWLANGFVVKSTRYGNAVSVKDVDGLHKLIAETLIDKPGRLTGKEFRFLRTQLDLSQEALGVHMDFSENAVSLWERKDAVPAACDQWVRMSVLAKFQGNTKLVDAIARTKDVHKMIYQKYVVKEVDGKRTVSITRQVAAPVSA